MCPTRVSRGRRLLGIAAKLAVVGVALQTLAFMHWSAGSEVDSTMLAAPAEPVPTAAALAVLPVAPKPTLAVMTPATAPDPARAKPAAAPASFKPLPAAMPLPAKGAPAAKPGTDAATLARAEACKDFVGSYLDPACRSRKFRKRLGARSQYRVATITVAPSATPPATPMPARTTTKTAAATKDDATSGTPAPQKRRVAQTRKPTDGAAMAYAPQNDRKRPAAGSASLWGPSGFGRWF